MKCNYVNFKSRNPKVQVKFIFKKWCPCLTSQRDGFIVCPWGMPFPAVTLDEGEPGSSTDLLKQKLTAFLQLTQSLSLPTGWSPQSPNRSAFHRLSLLPAPTLCHTRWPRSWTLPMDPTHSRHQVRAFRIPFSAPHSLPPLNFHYTT